MSDSTKFVAFEKYCNKCKYCKVKEEDMPCTECLEVGAREGTEVPDRFEEDTNGKKKAESV